MRTTIEQIMNWYYSCNDFRVLIFKHTENNEMQQEAYQAIAMIILEYDRQKIEDMWNRNELKYFIIRIIKNTLYSKTSPFYKKIKHFNDITSELSDDYDNNPIIEEDNKEEIFSKKVQLLKEIDSYLKQKENKSVSDYHDVALFRYYKYNKLTYRQIQDETKIHYTYVFRAVKRVEEEIINKFKDNGFDVI